MQGGARYVGQFTRLMNHNHMYLPQPLIAGWWLTYPSENISQMGFLFPIYGKKEGSKPPTRYCVCLTDLAKDLRENAIPCAPWTGLKLWPLSACEVSVKSVGNMGQLSLQHAVSWRKQLPLATRACGGPCFASVPAVAIPTGRLPGDFSNHPS